MSLRARLSFFRGVGGCKYFARLAARAAQLEHRKGAWRVSGDGRCRSLAAGVGTVRQELSREFCCRVGGTVLRAARQPNPAQKA